MRPFMFTRLRAWRALLLAALALVAGLASASSAAAEDTGPLFYGGSVTPSTLDFNGGQVEITAKGLDDFTIFMFYAEVTGPNAYVESVQLHPSSIPDDPNEPWTFTGLATIPPNTTGESVQYGFNATVTDTNGQVASGPVGVVDVGPAPAGEDAPPVISGGSSSPNQLTSQGGNVDLTAQVSDDRGLTSVFATIYGPDGAPAAELLPSGGDRFTGQFYAPPNLANEPVSYSVEVSATDTAGQETREYIGGFEVEGQPVFDQEPYLFDTDVAPRAVPARAGAVTFTATATDDRNISSVTAVVDLPGGGTASFDLNPADSYPRYSGVFDVPDNTSSTPLVYHVTIYASDDIGQTVSADAGSFTVAAAPTVAPGVLSLSPPWSLLGPVRPGSKTRATFVVRNAGKPGSATLTATAAISGSSFSLVGAPGSEKTLAIGPGQSSKVVVEFAPRRSGLFNGRLTIRRQDGLQRPLTATLVGLALP